MELKTVLKTRKTEKVLGDPSKPHTGEGNPRTVLDELLSDAGLAPFHHSAAREHLVQLSSPVPWRCYCLDRMACRTVMQELLGAGDSTKIPAMLSAAEFLVQVTWLPDPAEDQLTSVEPFSGNLRNMEHIAATAAMTQSLLLGATANGYRTYWSSGGPLREKAMFERLGIPTEEILLGSIFLFPAEIRDAEIRPGSMRDRRGRLSDWAKWLEIQ